jgi:hypothetical protein
MARIVALRDVCRNVTKYVHLVEAGREFVVVEGGKPLARMSRIATTRSGLKKVIRHTKRNG